MTDLVLVDGYNFIFHFIKAKTMDNNSLAFYRDRLINDLIAYHDHKKKDVVIVFDARHSHNQARACHYYHNIKVMYSKRGETADSVIEKLVESNQKYDKIYVVTSDYTQQKVIFKGNIFRKSSREFGDELNRTKKQVDQELLNINRKSSPSFYNLEKRLNKKTFDDISKIRKH